MLAFTEKGLSRLTSDSAGLYIIPIPGDARQAVGFTEERQCHLVMAY